MLSIFPTYTAQKACSRKFQSQIDQQVNLFNVVSWMCWKFTCSAHIEAS